MTTVELHALVTGMGEQPYRARQLADALYRQRVETLDAAQSLPAAFRQRLATDGYIVGLPELAQTFRSVDGTERYLVRLADGETVETVWMPNGDGGEAGDGSTAAHEEETEEDAPNGSQPRKPARVVSTLCLSSQVGCALNCQFCFTAKLGVRRNLTAGEIAGQVAAVLNRHDVLLRNPRQGRDPARINLVFMGMGEPFLNYEAFMGSVRLLADEMGIPDSRMTVSTSGIVPGILRFAAEPLRPKLAISLNAPNDDLREQIMPINRKWDLAAVVDAVRQVPLRPREKITFEYVLLGGLNDRAEDAAEVARLLRRSGLPLKVNLIAWNAGPGIPYATPGEAAVTAFQRQLIAAGIPAYIRRPRGRDIYAACGQLKRTVA
jgi:23S rRNA (adenine2503-C2)-methyltransferase